MIVVKDLCKIFSIPKKKKKNEGPIDARERGTTFHVLKEVSFTSERGEILGLLGPNGAGKTTLLRILSTALKPSSGSCTVNGLDIVKCPLEVRRKIGFLSGNTGLYGRLSAREILTYFGQLHRVAAQDLDHRIDELFTILDIHDYAHRRADTLSAGMKQKVNIARTLVHDPEVIVFDEPTTGLDVHASQTILTFIERCKDQGKTVIFSTHHMQEVEQLCDRILMIHQGQCCFSGTVKQMLTSTGKDQLNAAFLTFMSTEVTDVAV